MEKILKDYSEGKIHFTPIMNLMMGNRSKDWYAELGKYIVDTIDIEKVPRLSFLSDKLKQKKNIVTKMKDFLGDGNHLYFSVSSFFLTSALDDEALRKMFGEPLLHNEFGEGFDDRKKSKSKTYASYFVNVGGTNFHIGYDHRGTGIEVEISKKFVFGQVSDDEAQKCLKSLKMLVDLYKEKLL